MQAMNDGDLWQLHVRKASGETLTVEESQQLQAWYELQDQAEIAQLKLDAPTDSMNDLNTQIHEMLGHIAVVTKNIRQLTDANETLRQEILVLRLRLAQQLSLQPA